MSYLKFASLHASVIFDHCSFSIQSFLQTQVPPTANTLLRAKYWLLFSALTPPVGQNITSENIEETADKNALPPDNAAGKSFC